MLTVMDKKESKIGKKNKQVRTIKKQYISVMEVKIPSCNNDKNF